MSHRFTATQWMLDKQTYFCVVIAVTAIAPWCHIYASVNRVSIDSDDGLSPIRRQAIIYTNTGLLFIGPLGIIFNEISIKIKNKNFIHENGSENVVCDSGGNFVRGIWVYTIWASADFHVVYGWGCVYSAYPFLLWRLYRPQELISGRSANWGRYLFQLTKCVLIAETCLIHWDRVTHICVSKLTIIGSDNGLSPGRRQAIIWTNAGILLIRTLGTNFSEILGEIHSFSFSKMHLKMSSAKWRLGLNELTE